MRTFEVKPEEYNSKPRIGKAIIIIKLYKINTMENESYLTNITQFILQILKSIFDH